MLQRLFTLAVVLICVLWIAISYLPGVQAMLPTLSLMEFGSWMAWFSVVGLLIFVAIQLWLVYTTVVTIRAYQAKANNTPFRLRLGAEFFWTALPIAMTVGLAWASYTLWLNLT